MPAVPRSSMPRSKVISRFGWPATRPKPSTWFELECCNGCNAHLPGDFRNGKRVGFFNQQACVATARTCSAKAGKAPQKLRFRAARDTRSGNHEMRGSHRHPARVSAALLPKDISLYDAMRAIIGSELRSKLEVPKAMPSYLEDLLKELDDRLGSDQDGTTHSKRPANC